MPTNEQRRANAKRKLQRQLERRAQQARRRRTLAIVGGSVAAAVVVAAIVVTVVLTNQDHNNKQRIGQRQLVDHRHIGPGIGGAVAGLQGDRRSGRQLPVPAGRPSRPPSR